MLDLSQPVRTVAGVALAGDTVDPDRLYALPPGPTPARVGGVPDVHLLRFVRDGQLTGGHLDLAVQLAYPDATLAAAAAELTAQRQRPVAVEPVALQSGEAELVFFGHEDAAAGMVRRDYGRSLVQLAGPYRTVFALELTAAGVRLIEAAFAAPDTPVGVVCRLGVEGLWPAGRVTARVDWERVYDHLSTNYRVGALLFGADLAGLVEDLTERRIIEVQAVESIAPGGDAPAPSVEPALAWVQQELVERFCEPVLPLRRDPAAASLGTVGELLNLGAAFAIRSLTQIEHARAFVDFQQSVVVARTLAVQRPLTDLLGGDDPADHVSDAGLDHPFFRRFHLAVRPARPLAGSHLAEAVIAVRYGTADAAIRLTPDQPEGAFEEWADASPDGRWSATPQVTFSADAPVDAGRLMTLAPITGAGRDLTVDLEAGVGLVGLEVEAVADPRVVLSLVHLVQRTDGNDRAARDVSLTAAQPRQTAWFTGQHDHDEIVVSARHLLTDGRQVRVAPFVADTRLVRVPPAFADVLTVQLITDDDWSDLTRLVVAVGKGEQDPVGTVVFDRPGSAAVGLDLPDPTDRFFRYRVTRTLGSQLVEEDPWVRTDVPVVVVGRASADKLVVDIEPVGPELPAAGLLAIEVELLYVDPPNQVRDTHTHVIRARADRYRWEVKLADPAQRTYTYRTTRYRVSGERTVSSWLTSTATLLPIPITAG